MIVEIKRADITEEERRKRLDRIAQIAGDIIQEVNQEQAKEKEVKKERNVL